jgi:hypothetical protein
MNRGEMGEGCKDVKRKRKAESKSGRKREIT